MRVTEETKANAQAVFDYIIQHPEQHDQKMWSSALKDESPNITEQNVCNTTMCVAGTTIYLNEGADGISKRIAQGGWEDDAARYLGLNYTEGSMLFYCMNNDVALDMVLAIASGDEEKFDKAAGF